MASETNMSRLLALPGPCLLAVVQCCADDANSVLSAATAHSRLQRAAVEALRNISASISGPLCGTRGQARLNSLLLYLAKHGQHVRSLALRVPYGGLRLCELPRSLTKLDSLLLECMDLQLQPGDGAQGVLRAGLPLTRLELSHCSLLDGAQGLAAALAQLPDLQHLGVVIHRDQALDFPTDVLTHLGQLTCLLIKGIVVRHCRNSSSSDPSAALQPLQALTRLADLQLDSVVMQRVTTSALSGVDQLTRLVLFGKLFEPRALAGREQLQHLTLRSCSFVPGTGVAQLLSELQHLTQLTYLDLSSSCWLSAEEGAPIPPPAAYASLTASSKLQHLDFNSNTLPSAAWQHMCPPGRTLPQLTHLNLSYVTEADGSQSAPDTSALVSCCPGLQSVTAINMRCRTAQLAPLRRLTGLTTLTVGNEHDPLDELEGMHALCQLTGLLELNLCPDRTADARILQLTQLTRLTALTSIHSGSFSWLRCNPQDPAAEPVWRQLLRQLLKSNDPEVAQQAAAALAAA